MANLNVWALTWVDAGETGLVPGATHHWWMTGFSYGTVVSLMASPVNSDVGEQVLQVSNMRIDANMSGGRTCYFSVTNVGPVRAIGYAVNISFANP